jgi:hypothetical protein
MPRLIDKMIRHLDTIPHGTRFFALDFLPVLEKCGSKRDCLSGMIALMLKRGLIVEYGRVRKLEGGRPQIIWMRTAPAYVEPVKVEKFKPVKLKKSAFGDLVRSQLGGCNA